MSGRTLGVVDIMVDPRQIANARSLLAAVPRGVRIAQMRAVNKVGAGARKRIVTKLWREMAVSQRSIRKHNVWLERGTYSDPWAVLSIVGRRIPLKEFQARKTRKGVTYRIRRTGKRKLVKHAFLQTTKKGKYGVFVRAGRGKDRQPKRPLIPLFGPSAPEVVADVKALSERILSREIGAKLQAEFSRQINVLLGQMAGTVAGSAK